MDFSIEHDPRADSQNNASALLAGLNPQQAAAVQQTEGPVLVLAGAGTGKTRVLTTRLAYLLQTGKAVPAQILAVTFTNKAAQEMKLRVSESLGGRPVEGWWLGTFHSLCVRMLRSHADLVGLSSNFTILDSDDQVRLMKQLMEGHSIDPKKSSAKDIINKISAWKDKAKTPHDIQADDVGDFADGKMLVLYKEYQARLKILNACDFGDLLLHVITILKDPSNANLLADYQRRFQYILVDEYQDTNVAQYLWLRLLTKGKNNICCVGDDDQSIYGWRGAEVDNILRFEQDFPGATIIRLEENYRSTGHILSAANGVIGNNTDRLGKELFTSAGAGEKVKLRGLWDGQAEARYVGEEIEAAQSKGQSLNDMAVLVRAGFQMRIFEERFIQLGLPYRVIGGPRFYERKEIRDALAYLRVVMQGHDDLALERIINVPKRGIGDATVKILHTHARAKKISLYQSIIDLTQTEELKPKIRGTLMKLIDDFERWKSMMETTHHSELAAIILDDSGYNDMWKMDKAPDSPGRLENLKEFVSGMEDFEDLQQFLEHIALVLENQNNDSGEFVTLMTLHGAKGLEFDLVFLPGWEDGLFPSQRSMDENGTKGLEEERRLAYVAITRAKRRAIISYVGSRFMYGSWVNSFPSRFIDELPEEHIEVQAEMGLAGSETGSGSALGRSSHWDSSGYTKKAPPRQPTLERTSLDGELKTGDRVFHEKFGHGIVVYIDGHKLDINFEAAGQKRVMDSFVTKA